MTLCGWVQKVRDKGGMIWIDLRDRYGITQLIFDESKTSKEIVEKVRELGREFVIKATGKVVERFSKNDKIPTGDVEIEVSAIGVCQCRVVRFRVSTITSSRNEPVNCVVSARSLAPDWQEVPWMAPRFGRAVPYAFAGMLWAAICVGLPFPLGPGSSL